MIDVGGEVLGERVFEHGGEGLVAMADWLLSVAAGEAAAVGVAIEVPRGPVVESLLEWGFVVHSINPKQLDRFRDRISLAGAKDDRRDARVLASALRTDGHCLRRLEPTGTLVRTKRQNIQLVWYPAVPDPRMHENRGTVVRGRWHRRRILYVAESPFLSLTRSPASIPYCETGSSGERAV